MASEHIGAIASASNEQAAALEQINRGVIQVSQVVQSNAAASEECAAASEELSSQADSLKESVSIFKLNTDSLLSGENSDSQKPKSKNPGGKKAEENRMGRASSKPSISLSDNNFGKY